MSEQSHRKLTQMLLRETKFRYSDERLSACRILLTKQDGTYRVEVYDYGRLSHITTVAGREDFAMKHFYLHVSRAVKFQTEYNREVLRAALLAPKYEIPASLQCSSYAYPSAV